jgi:hypothetical protein
MANDIQNMAYDEGDDGTTIKPAGSILSCSTVNIGAAPTIVIDPSYYTQRLGVNNWTLRYIYGSQAGNIVQGSRQRTITSYSWPLSFYDETPYSTVGYGVLYLELYKGAELIEEFYKEFSVSVNISASTPTISLPRVVDTDDLTTTLTLTNQDFIKFHSNAEVSVTATARNGATIKSVEIYNGGKTKTGTSAVFDNIEDRHFQIRATDSRGLVTQISYTIPETHFIDYVKLTCNLGNDKPDTDGNMTLTCSGNYFDGNFGEKGNSLSVKYRYKEKNSDTWSSYRAMSVSISGNTYSAEADIAGLEYTKTYVFECQATDELMVATTAATPVQSTPVFHWSKDDFVHETPVNFNAGIMFNGVEGDYIEEQGESREWIYRKWHSGRAECWGRFTRSVYGSDWTAWGALYQAEVAMNEALPFTFADTHKEFATLHSLAGAFVSAAALGMSNSTTAAYFAVHPNKLSSTYSFLLDIYAVGRWK